MRDHDGVGHRQHRQQREQAQQPAHGRGQRRPGRAGEQQREGHGHGGDRRHVAARIREKPGDRPVKQRLEDVLGEAAGQRHGDRDQQHAPVPAGDQAGQAGRDRDDGDPERVAQMQGLVENVRVRVPDQPALGPAVQAGGLGPVRQPRAERGGHDDAPGQ
jgi:hypothetical protein